MADRELLDLTVYVAGPMSGIEAWNYPAFDAVAQALESVGYTVVNPANHFDRDTTRPRADYIRQSLHDVETVDALALLSNWDKSEGARLEFEYARQLGIPAYDWRDLYTLKTTRRPAPRVTELPRTLSSVNLTDEPNLRDTIAELPLVQDPRLMPGEAVVVPDDFYEPDEPVEDVVKAYHEGEKTVTAPVSGTYGDTSLFCGDRECSWCERNGYIPGDVPNGSVRDPNTPFDLLARSNVPKADEVWAEERNDILNRFRVELAKATGDGSKKRQAGEKPPWYRDDGHEGAIFSHLTKWKRGERVDPDSGAHPLVHAAWRALAIACRETGNVPEPDEKGE